jgi:hypothetical protein
MQYQILHNFEGFLSTPQQDGMSLLLGKKKERLCLTPEKIAVELHQRLKSLKDCGIDGLVVNVGGDSYLDSEFGWELFLKGLASATELGFDIWIYDENGYPSGSAGGFVLINHPEFEAVGIKQAAITDENGITEFCYFTDKLYEGTHASRNYAEKRRYINLLDAGAVRAFIEVTHESYRQNVPEKLFNHVSAFFTDEPSLMSVIVNELDDRCGFTVPVQDPVDPQCPILPCIPYGEELDRRLSAEYGISLMEAAPAIFEFSQEPSVLKCSFWEMVSLVYEKTFALQLSDACQKLGKKLTGHILYEETPFGNMAFHSNPFRVLKHFQLPGVDLLHSNVLGINIYSHKLPFSCAFLTGKKGIMTETSDFSETWIGIGKHIGPETMASILSMQFLLGVHTFSYYYDFRARTSNDYRMATEVIRRTCLQADGFEYAPEVAIYCPFETIWSYYTPTILSPEKAIDIQPKVIQDTQKDLLRLCDELFHRNVQFILFDCSSVDEILSKGVSKAILPHCSVISLELLKAVESGLELFGEKPDYYYSKGSLKKIESLSIKPMDSFIPTHIPFTCDALYVSSYKGNRYYCFNPKDSKISIVFEREAYIYDPFQDVESQIAQNGGIEILPGQALIVSLSD